VRRTLLRGDPDPRVPYFDSEQLDLFAALAKLSSREREAIVLHHLVGHSVDEIAAQLGAPRRTVKSWLSRGRVRLAQLLTPEEVSDELR
jgi:RNA polymerase sigma-70 factor (ECF subfamily)